MALDVAQVGTTPPARLIVHADDFGLSEAVNLGILDAHLSGVLTSTSVMASGEAFDHAVKLSKDHPSLDVGIHLTLVEERPTLDPKEISSLVGNDGRFHKHATIFARKYLQRRISLDDVRRELDSQIRKVLASGLPISHLDSHQHLHMLPGILKITFDLAGEYDIPWVRFPREALGLHMFKKLSGMARVLQMVVLNSFCCLGERRFAIRTDHFAGFYYGGALNKDNLLSLISNLPVSGTCELMCHPGRDDPSTARGHWAYRWPDELEALTSFETREALKTRGLALTSYRDLPKGSIPA